MVQRTIKETMDGLCEIWSHLSRNGMTTRRSNQAIEEIAVRRRIIGDEWK